MKNVVYMNNEKASILLFNIKQQQMHVPFIIKWITPYHKSQTSNIKHQGSIYYYSIY